MHQIIDYLVDFTEKSEAQYHVNPWIFAILFFGSAIPLYFGYFLIGKSALKIEDKRLKRKEVDKKLLKIGLIVSIVAWWIPYLYVILFGRLSAKFWIIFGVFVIAMAAFFAKTLLSKVSKAKQKEDSDL